MQSWHPVPDGADPDSAHGNWAPGYGLQGQTGQYDNSPQTWNQPLSGQPMYTSIAPNPTTNTHSFYPNNTHQNGAVLGDGVNGVSQAQQGSFAGQGGLPQYRPAQDSYNPGFESLQQDAFGQQGKLDLRQGLSDMNQAQPHQGQPSTQGFAPQAYTSYPASNEQAFGSGLPISAPSKMLSGSVPAFDRIHQPSQQKQQQNQQPQQQQQQQQQPFQHAQVFAQPSQQPPPRSHSFEHAAPAYSPSGTPQGGVYHASPGHAHPPSQQQTQLQPQTYSQAYLQPQPTSFSQPQTSDTSQSPAMQYKPALQIQPNIPQSAPAVASPAPPVQVPVAQGAKRDAEQVGTPQSAQDSSELSASTEPAPKKRKRAVKKTSEPQVIGGPELQIHNDVVPRGTGDTGVLPLPGSNNEDLALIDAFRKGASTQTFPPIYGAPSLAKAGTVKLPTPKSHDKLAPLVAMPPQSGKRIFPDLGRGLPCEIQGEFSARFRPSASGAGLEDRKRDAKDLLAEYEKSMESLGNRRPKYTEYPHAFKEQLKADEAVRTKAERLARKLAEEERNKPARPETRPLDPAEGAAWDIIGFVHIPPSATRTTALLAGAVQQAGEYIMSRRGEMTRAKLDVDQATKDKADAELPGLTATAELKKEVLYRTLEAANRTGDEAVLENLGGHGKLVLSLVNLLITCIKTSDFSGKLPKAALSLMANFKMSQKVATQTNFDNIRRRLADKGDAEVKELLGTIASRVKKEADATGSPKKPSTAPSATTKPTPASSKLSTESMPTKRARPDEVDSRVAKKQAVEYSGSAQPVASKAGVTATAQPKTAPPKPRVTGGILPGKSRPAPKPAPKTAASKVESSKAEPAKTAGDKPGPRLEVKKPVEKAEPKPSSSSALGGIASLLDSINAPKAQPKPEKKEPKDEPEKDETPEEREKRLRKQARRQLRVSWKADNELEQVRFFHKEDEEEGSFDSRMTRDAGDDKLEGMVLKQRGMMMDEDEDEEEDDDIPYRPWLEPTPMDFSSIPADYRRKTYQTRGGDVVVETDEQRAIAEREQTVLMAFYPDVADIPPTPKSPSIRAAEPAADVKIGHLPRDDPRFEEVHRRWKEVQQLGKDGALQYATKRIESKQHPSNKVNSVIDSIKFAPAGAASADSVAGLDPRNSLSTMPRDEQVLMLLASDRVKQWRSTEPQGVTKRRHDYADPRVQYAADIVEDLVPKLSGPHPATEPPAWMKDNAEAAREWWLGYNRDATAKSKKDADERARADSEQAASQSQAGQDAWAAYYAQQQQAYAPYMAILQQLQGGQAAAPSVPVTQPGQQGNGDQLQAVLAALGHPQAQSSQTAGGAAPQMHPNDPTYQQLLMLAQMAQQPAADQATTPTYGSGAGRDWEREREAEREWGRDRDRDYEHDGDDKRGRKHKGTLPPHRPVNRALIGTKPCVFFKQGTCARGDQCTFRHEA